MNDFEEFKEQIDLIRKFSQIDFPDPHVSGGVIISEYNVFGSGLSICLYKHKREEINHNYEAAIYNKGDDVSSYTSKDSIIHPFYKLWITDLKKEFTRREGGDLSNFERKEWVIHSI